MDGTDFAQSITLAQPMPVHSHPQSPGIRPIGTRTAEIFQQVKYSERG